MAPGGNQGSRMTGISCSGREEISVKIVRVDIQTKRLLLNKDTTVGKLFTLKIMSVITPDGNR
ncbi:hypothetical protein CLV58_11576 [Spirosoma oryzae]|uniref:Uncharacterized protein n=1 Tax=Spirosoma oryzae TaxID=1469603 RepID=A0A2T0SNP8_9BACT|nr:hypothetical protein CLV58_11576 [Spirosoma oryzae]